MCREKYKWKIEKKATTRHLITYSFDENFHYSKGKRQKERGRTVYSVIFQRDSIIYNTFT